MAGPPERTFEFPDGGKLRVSVHGKAGKVRFEFQVNTCDSFSGSLHVVLGKRRDWQLRVSQVGGFWACSLTFTKEPVTLTV